MPLTLRRPPSRRASNTGELRLRWRDHSPALGGPARRPARRSHFALIVDDPDAPTRGPEEAWVHWILYDLPASCDGAGGARWPEALPPGTLEGTRTLEAHRRTAARVRRSAATATSDKLTVLDTMLGDLGKPTKESCSQAMKGHILGTDRD